MTKKPTQPNLPKAGAHLGPPPIGSCWRRTDAYRTVLAIRQSGSVGGRYSVMCLVEQGYPRRPIGRMLFSGTQWHEWVRKAVRQADDAGS